MGVASRPSGPSWLESWICTQLDPWSGSWGPDQQSTQSCILSNKGELVTRRGTQLSNKPLFLFPFKKVSDFIACGKNQRNKLKEAQHVFGADQKHRTFESS